MAAQTVLVTQLTGQAWIRNTDGTLTAIHEGMRIAADAVIVTSSGGSVQLQADGQPPLIVGENQEVLLTADLVAPPQPQEAAIAAPPATEIDQIIAAINAGQDPFDTLDPTAATLSGGSEGGSTFVRLASVVEATAPLNLAFDRTGAGPADTLFAADGAAAPATPDTNPDIGSVLEDALPLTGNLLTNDTLGDGSLAQHSVLLRGGSQGQFGQITLNSDGSYSYQLDNALPAVQALAAGETRTETFTYELVDRNGASSINTLTITIIGTNDAPTLSGEATVAVQEDQTTAVSGQLVAADVDVGDTQTWSVNNGGQGQYGSFTVDQTGKWTYVPGAGNAQVQGLKTGEQLTDTITVTVSDGKGGSATQTVTVVIEGADDAAIITPAAPGSDLGRVQEDVTLTTSGKLDVTDPDAGQAVFVAQVAAAGQYGSFSVDASGNWSFALDNGGETVQALGAGETVTETFTVTTADGTKGSVVITIVGTNDQPELSGALTGTVTENGIQTAIGQMITTDVDAKDTHSYSVIGNATGTYGSFSVDANGQWTYQLDNDAAQPLRAGETRTETYQVQVSDGQGGVDTQTVTITINGADVSAIITPAVPGADRGAVTEDGQLSAVGKLNVVDPDEGQAVFVAVTASAGQYGSFSIDVDGNWNYALNNNSPLVQSLGTGETRTESFTVTTADGTTGSVVITINGTNDQPVLSGALTGTVTEDGTQTAIGQLATTDVDTRDTHSYSVVGSATGTYGSFSVNASGQWAYQLNNAAAQPLNAGETRTETYQVQVSDGKGGVDIKDITITINGTDEGVVVVPGIPGNDAGAVQEDVTLQAGGKLEATDPDAPAVVFVPQTNVAGQYGSFSVDASGNWTFALNNSDAKVQALAANETRSETFTVTTADGAASSVVITITGSNDAPTITGTAAATISDSTASISGDLNPSDVDAGDTHTWSVGTPQGQYGSLTVDADGKWTYELDSAKVKDLPDGQKVTDTITVTVTDSHGATGTKDVVITINGSGNNTPTIGGAATGEVTEDIKLSVQGALTISDPDAGQSTFVAQSAVTTTYGKFSIDASGNWNYELNNTLAAVQALGLGQTLTETREVFTADGTKTSVVITITGSNDAPTITGTAAATISDSTASISGDLNPSDVDAGDTHTWSVGTPQGQYGSLTVDADGKWTYELDSAKVKDLPDGQKVTDTITVTVTDSHGATGTKDVVITINGSGNNTPTIGGADTGEVIEDDKLSVQGALTISDPDAGQSTFVAQSAVTTTYGKFSIDASGNWNYELNNTLAAVQALGLGQTLTETREVFTADGTKTSVVITITGSNDAPTITGTAAATISDSTASISGDLNPSDVDAGDTHTWSVGTPQGQYGSLTVDADGKWTYELDSAKVKDLPDGQKVTDTITVTVTDSHGATGTKDVVITINGSGNNTPTIGGAATGEVIEDDKLTTGGKLDITDPDAGEAVFQPQTGTAGDYGSFKVDANGNWTYTLTNTNPAVQALGVNETLSEAFTVKSADGTTHTVNIVINGTNDVPEVTGPVIGAVTEDGTTTASGQLEASDVDKNDTLTWKVTGSATGNYGTIAIDQSGKWTYTLDDDKAAALTSKDKPVESFTVTVSDGHGGTVTKTIDITVNGADNGATITPHVPGDDQGTVTEDTKLSTGGKLDITDPDAGEAVFQPQTDAGGTYGKFSIDANGNWTYTLTNTNPAVQALGVNETLGEAFTVKSADGTTHTVNIVINGTNDVPEVTGPVIGAVTEDGTTTASGQLEATDVDKNDTLTWEVTGSATGNYGTIAIDQSGKWTYTLDDDKAAALTSKDHPVETFTVTVSDGHGGTVTKTIDITVNGADNGATITPHLPGDDQGTVTEDTKLSTGGKLDVTDPDAGEAVFQPQTGTAGDYGSFKVDANGNWTYTLTNTNPAVQALGVNETLGEAFTVKSADGTTHTVNIVINGTNDVPEVTGPVIGAVTEDGTTTASGQLEATDVDKNDTLTWEVTGSATGNYGTIAIDQSGKWTYTLDDDKAQALTSKDHPVETFTVTVSDGHGGTVTKTIDITVNGADNGATITPHVPGDDQGTVIEDTKLSTGGKLDVTDPDAGQAVFVAQNDVATTYGKFSIDANGTWTYNLTNTNAAVQALGAGQTLTETREVVTADGTKTNVVITINGTNDVPTLGAGVSAVTEDVAVTNGKLSTSGTVSISDIDTGESSFKEGAVFNGSGTALGTLVFNTNGSYSYSVDNSKVQYLKTGESVVETYTVTSKDGSATSTIKITINGADNGATITPHVPGDDQGTVTEDTKLSTGGKLDITDPDAGEAVFQPQTDAGGTYGKFSIDANGNWTYTLTNTNPAVQALGVNETLGEAFTVKSADGTTHTVNIVINGTNDVPEVTGPVIGAVTEDGTTTASGQLEATDVDKNDTLTWEVTGSATGNYGTIAIDQSGKWTYTLDDDKAQALTSKDKPVESFTVTVSDGHGGTVTKTIDITVNGADNGATITPHVPGDDQGTVTEDTKLSTGGKLDITDPDAGEAVFQPQTGTAGDYGSFKVDANGNWTYTLANTNPAVQALGVNETLGEAFTVKSADGTTHTVNIVINGTNDVPEVTGPVIGAVTEDGTTTASGQLEATDVDKNDTLTWEVTGSATGNYGTIAIDQSGKWTYTLDDDKAQALTSKDKPVETFTVTVSDGHGGTVTKTIDITVNGADNGATITPHLPGDDQGTVTEDTKLSTGGKLDITDPDAGEAVFQPQTGTAGDYGSFKVDANGNWTYTLTNTNPAVQALGVNETLGEAFTVKSADGTTHTVNIVINGTNDVPEVTGPVIGAVTEDGTTTASGQLEATDVDKNDTLTWEVTGSATGNYGTIAIDQSGKWTYTLDDDKAAALTSKDKPVESFTVTVSDGHGGTVTKTIDITVNGADNGATITPNVPGADQGTVTEDTKLSTGGKLDVTDPDAGQAVFVAQNDVATTYGKFSIDANGTWTYTLTNTNAAVQALGAGQTLTETREVVTADGTKTNVVITINGTNDVPTLGAGVSAVTEDVAVTNGKLSTSGTVSISDIDTGESSFKEGAVFNGSGTALGTLVFNTNGSYSYTVDNSKVQYLKTGESVVETYTVTSKDGSATSTIKITINGADDGAVITPNVPGDDQGTVTEDTKLSTGGKLDITDPDAGEAVFQPQTGTAGDYGSFKVDANGNWTYTLTNTNPAVQALGVNETLSEAFTVKSADGTTHTVNIVINGTNDVPEVTGPVIGAVTEDGTTTASGQLEATDVDKNDTLTWEVTGSATGNYGTIAIDQSGKWTYTLDDDKAQALTSKDKPVESFTVTVSDGHGGTVTKTIDITVNGADNGATITPHLPGDDQGTVTEDTKLSTGGKLDITDPDAGEAVFQPQTDAGGTYGKFSIDANGNWTYTLTNTNPAVQALGVNETLSEAFTVKSADGTTHTVNIVINGTNDVPEVTGPVIGAVTEDGTTTASGQLEATDVDKNDTLTWEVTGSATGNYGTIAIDQSGKWTYTLDDDKAQALTSKDKPVESFTVTVSDGHGGTVTKTIDITVNGADNGATITPHVPGDDQGTVTEDTKLSTGGKLDITDPDAGEAVFQPQTGTAGDYGSFKVDANGNWTYTLTNTNPAVQALGVNETLGEAFTVKSADGTTHTVNIVINGTNDVPEVTGPVIGAVTEDGTTTASGQLEATDVDKNDTLTWEVTGSATGNYGTIAIDQSGKWTYTLDDDKAAALTSKDKPVESFTVTVSDGHGGTVTKTIDITVNGADNGATITPHLPGDDQGTVTEDTKLSTGGKLDITDPDAGEAVFQPQTDAGGDYGSFKVDANGNWTYTLTNTNPAVQALGVNETLSEAFTVKSADGTTHTVNIVINGTNDVPEVTGPVIGAVTEDGTTTASGQLEATDVDKNDTLTWEVTGSATGNYGTIAIDQSGKWTYTLDDDKAQALTSKDHPVETFTVTVSDGHGGTVTKTIDITVNGADNGATITPHVPGDDQGTVTEDTKLSTGGKLDVTDPDAGEAVFQPQTGTAGDYGSFKVDANGNWTYTLTNTNPAVQALGVNETLGEAFTVKSADGTTHTVNIVINGTNDVPEVTGPVIGAVTEDGTTTASGQLEATDVDKNDTLTWEVTGSATGNYGTIAIDQSGKWTYTLDDDKAAALTSKDHPVETFTVTVSDGHGGTVTKTIDITVNGADNGATITPHVPGDDQGTVIEDTKLSTGGKLDVTDPDAGQAVFVAQNDVATTYGKFSIGANGTWTYNLTNTNAAVQALGAGQTLTETREVVTADGTKTNVVITINGTNDVPTLGAGVSAVTEDVAVTNGKLSTSGTVSISDIDTGESSFKEGAVFNGSGTALGTLVFNTNGSYSYTVDNSKVQYLKAGESVVETYTVTSKDGSATSTIKITINGADDGAVITPNVPGADQGTVIEDTKLSTGGKLDVTDPDAGQAVFVAQNDVATTYGKFSIDANGTWTYNLTNTNAAVQALGAGQTLTETREVVTADGTKTNVVITINGTNDVPTLGAGVSAVTEDVAVTNGKLSTSGTVSINDIDTGESSFKEGAVFNGSGTALGTLVFNTNGSYSYAVDNSKVQYLKTGESVVETYTVTSKDGSATSTIKITINGADDGAVITPNVPGADQGTVIEDTKLSTGGKLDVTDPDAGQAVFVAQNDVATTYGKFSIDANGTWTYTLTNTNAAVQALGAGQTLTETREVVTADGTKTNVVITINGTNDVPTLGAGVSAVTEDVAVTNGKLSTSGTVSISDIDTGESSFKDGAVFNGSGTALGTLVFNTNGSYSYTVDNSKVQYLKAGESVVETYTVTSKDGSATSTIKITINGADDGAVITPNVPGADQGTVIEDTKLSTGGKLDVTDPDAGQAVFVAQNDVATTYGKFSIDANGTWTYTLTNTNAAVQALGAGQTLTETREVVTADGTKTNVVITINGTNDVPTLGAGVSAVTEDVAVTNGKLSTSGTVSISDIDTGESSFKEGAVFNGSGTALGTLVFNTNGSYSYTVDNSKVQYLKAGESVVETYTVTSKDGSATSTIKITINGADDGAVITPNVPGADQGAVTEDTKLSTGGKLDVTDPDAGQAVFVAQNDVATTYGKFSIDANGTWTYNLTNTNAAVQALGAGQTLTETREVVTADGTKTNVVITINGTNDVPTLGAGVSAVTEDVAVTNGKLSTSGTVSINDIDTGESSFKEGAVFNGSGTALGTLVFNTNGSYSYTVDNSKVQYLKTGESVVETYTVTSKDGSATSTIKITINGADDGAVITPNVPGADKGTVTEDTKLSTGGKLDVTDPDAGQTVFVAQNDVATTYGKFSIDANGTWTYNLTNTNAAVQALGAGQTLTETREVVTADGTKTNVVITINGTNDVPTLGTGVSAVTEDVAVTNGKLSTSGTVSINDIDTGESSFKDGAVFNGSGTALGTLVFNTNGSYSYTVDNSKVQYLKAGESVVETYTVTSKDGSASTTIKITINGADDGAVITPNVPGADKGTVIEDTKLSTGGKLDVTDPDAGQAVFVAQNDVATTYGKFSIDANGTWTYNLTNTNAAVQALGAGQTLTETREVVTADGTKTNVVITINGTNDVPTLGTGVSAVTEDVAVTNGKLSTSGTVSINDIDTGESSFKEGAVFNGSGTALGTLVFNTNGSYSYTVDNSKVQYLKAGESVVETYTVTSKDGSASTTIKITINGTNDVPTLGSGTGSVTEDLNVVDGKLVASGTVSISDADTGESSFKEGAVFNGSGTALGTLVFNTNGSYSYSVDNSKVQYLKAGESLVETYTVTSKDGSASTTIKITINGTNEAPVVQAVSGTAPEDNIVTVVLRGTDADGTVASFQLASLAANGTFYKDAAGTDVLKLTDVLTAAGDGTAKIYFKPAADWSGTTTFDYNAKDNLGQVSTSPATGTVTVTPVADTPVVNVQVGSGSAPVTTSITASTVGTASAGHTVTAKNADGGNASVSIVTGTNHDGFGVSGAITTNTAAASEELAGNGSKSESLTIAFNVPVTKITVQFAWLASGEQARYVMYDEAGNVIKTATVQGVTDTVDEQFSLTAPVGTTIGKIVFDAPRNGDDYLIHKVTYTTATTYPLTITADPRDVDHSETISKVVVEVPAGVTLSVGTQIDATHWSLPLTSNGSYAVSVDAATKAITITGLKMTVPENVSVGEVKVVATASDGSSTAEGSYTYHGVPVANDDTATATLTSRSVTAASTQTTLANFSTGETNAWKYASDTRVDKDTADFSTNAILKSDTTKWLSSSLNNSTLDAQISSNALVLMDNNGRALGDAQLATPVYTSTVAGTTLQFKVTALANMTNSSDWASWSLYKSTDGGVNWAAQPVQSALITGAATITTSALDANATYRIVLTVHEGSSNNNDAAVTFDDFVAIVPGATSIQWTSSPINGSVTANDTLGTLGETSTLSVFNGSSWVSASAGGTTVNGSYGTLVLKSDGSYTYTPTASAAGAGKVDHFEYKLTQADGDSATANLDINIEATGPGAPSTLSARMALTSTETSEHEVHSTSSSDTLLGTADDDLFVWHQGDAGTVASPVTDVVKNFGAAGNDKLDLADLLQGEEAANDLSKYLHLETRTEADGKTIDTVINVSTAGTLDAAGNGFNQQILIEGVNLTGTSHDQNTMIKELIEQGKLKIDHSGS